MKTDITRYKRKVCEDKIFSIRDFSSLSMDELDLLDKRTKGKIPFLLTSIVLAIAFWYFLYRYADAELIVPGLTHIGLYIVISILSESLFERYFDNNYLENQTQLESFVAGKTIRPNTLASYYEVLVIDYEKNASKNALRYLHKIDRIRNLQYISKGLFNVGMFFGMYFSSVGQSGISGVIFLGTLFISMFLEKSVEKICNKQFDKYLKEVGQNESE